jgi:short-subunit dehydrogenase
MGATVVVTGASSGIGAAMARAWAHRGATLVLGGRDAGSLERVASEVRALGGRAVVAPGDVTLESDRVRLLDAALAESDCIDVLVNNAGRGYYGPAARIDLAELEELFALNVFAPLRLAQLSLEALRRSRGTIVMVSSVAGVVAAPSMGAYAASKFALEALSMTLRAELAADGVRVVVVRPGPVDTAFRRNSIAREGKAGVRPTGARVQSADEVAAQVLRAVDARRSVVETTAFARVASATARVTPGAMRWISARMARRAR